MRKLLILLCVLIAGFASTAQAGPVAKPKPMTVAVGLAPVEYFAKKIGGQFIRTVVLVPAGADAHTYEPKPSQMRELSRAGLYLSAGLEFEQAWEPRLKAVNNKLVFVHLEQGLALMPMPEGHGGHGHDDHGKSDHDKDAHGHKAKAGHGHDEESDPHIWVSPANVRHMAAHIAEAFAKADPAQAQAYSANLAAFLKEIDALDAELRTVFAGIPADKRGFLVFHPAWGYLARDYGLTQTAIEFEGKEPSPRRLGAMIAQARKAGVKVIFVQPQMSRRTAESIAQALGARVLAVDPLAADWAANLRAVAGTFRQALR